MHSEFLNAIRRAIAVELEAVLLAEGIVSPSSELSETLLRLSLKAELDEVPDGVLSDVATAAPYKIAKELVALEEPGAHVAPRSIAEVLAAILNKKYGDSLACTIGGEGHINGVFSEAAKYRLLIKLIASQFVSGETLLLDGSSERVDSKLPLEHWAPIKSNWEAVIERVRSQRVDEEVEVNLVVERARGGDKNSAIMLFAAGMDDELSFRPFLQGLYGRQNVPWYLNKFKVDARSFSEKCEEIALKNASLEGASSNDLLQSENLFDSIGRFPGVTQSKNLILSLRGACRDGWRRKRPELVVGHVVLMARSFYEFFNLPTIRQPQIKLGEASESPRSTPHAVSPPELRLLGLLSGVSARGGSEALENIRSSL